MSTGLRSPEVRLSEARQFPRPELLAPRLPADQLELLRLLATGLSDQAIGRRLDLSRRTVQRRVRSLMDTFGVQTRFQLGMRAATQLDRPDI